MTKHKKILTSIIFTLACAPLIAGAADYLPKNKAESANVIVAGDKEYKNLFVGGGNVAVNKKILGDLFAAGSSLNIASPIEKDLFAAGGNMAISAAVGDDARVAGGNIAISSPVSGDLMVAGGTVNISQTATIGGDFWTGAGILNLNGNVGGNAKIAGDEILINSEIKGDVEIRSGKKLVFGPQSKILGKITHWGLSEAIAQDGAQLGQIEFHKVERKGAVGRFNFGRALSVFFLIRILALFATALVVIKLFGKTASNALARPHARPWMNLGLGFLGVIAAPVAIILLFASVLGSLVGLILMFGFILTILFSMVLTALFIGSLLERWIFKKKGTKATWQTAAWGVAAMTIAGLIPIIGPLAIAAAFFMIFGSLLQEAKIKIKSEL